MSLPTSLSPQAPPPPPEAAPAKGFLGRHPLWVGLGVLLIFLAILTALLAVGFSQAGRPESFSKPFSLGEKIAVVKIEGVILDSEDTLEDLKRFKDNSSVKAVVLRVDSPGGAVGPSQEIYQEVKRLAATKTVVASFGGVAASGAYYAACPATKIMASPGTITGSIGVVMEITNLEKLLEWMKIRHSVIKSGEFKDVGSPFREMTPKERAYLQAFIDDVHAQFEEAVVEGRHLTQDKVHRLADGRIFTGRQAKALGLVDEMGNVEDAIHLAAKLVGIEGEPNVIWPRPPRPFWLSHLFEGLAREMAKEIEPSSIRALYLLPGF